MGALPKSKLTIEEYIELDFEAEGRYEYFDGEAIEMSGGSPEHSLISNQIGFLLRRETYSKNCSIYNSDLKIKVPTMPPYRYADVSALCGQPVYENLVNQRLLVNPTLIVEVLSNSTGKYDRDLKFKGYKSIVSLKEYLLISQIEKFVVLYTKYNEKFWFQSEYVEGETLKLESLECNLIVDEIYQGIVFETESFKRKFINGEEII